MLDIELIRNTLSQYAKEIKSVGFTDAHDNHLKLSLVWVDSNDNEKQWNYQFPVSQLNRIDTGDVVALITSDANVTGG